MRALLFYPDNMVKGTILPPYSLLYLAKALMKEGHEAVILDGRFEDKKTIEDEISRTDLFAVSAGMNLQFATALPFAKMAKGYGVPVLFGGVFSTLNHEALLKYPNIDGICLGEGEVAIVEALEKGVRKASNVAYLDGGIHRNPQAPFINLDHYTPLPWDLTDMERYVTRYKDMDIFYYTTSRGCPHRCDYCYQGGFWNRRWRGMGVEKVKEEIHVITESVDIDGVYLFDDNFLVNRRRAEEITQYFREKGLKWSCMTRASYLDEALVKHIKESGCFKLNIGAESGSQATLERMKKDIRIEDTLQAARLLGEAGLSSEFYFMIGYQGETMEDITKTVVLADQVERLSGAETFIRVALPFKGTPYYEAAREAGFERRDDLISLCTEDWGRRPPHLPWLSDEENRIVKNIATLSEIRFMKKKFLANMPLWERVYISMIYPLLELRWKRRLWKSIYELVPYELYESKLESRRLKDSLEIAGGMERCPSSI
jgi:radical SAM superfamily enzyme YgiQ (UPF0313 family)